MQKARGTPRRVLLTAGAALAVAGAATTAVVLASTPSVGLPIPTYLNAVSCASPSSCVAVGSRLVHRQHPTDVVVLSSTTLTPIRSGMGHAFESVSCGSANWCMTVGFGHTHRGIQSMAEAEIYSAGEWRSIPGPPGGDSRLSLSCVADDRCMAVTQIAGQSLTTGGAAWWGGSSWREIAIAKSDLGGQFAGVSCARIAWCMVIGAHRVGRHQVLEPFSAIWDGKTLRSMPVPPTRSLESTLLSVSCNSATACLALGYSVVGNPNHPTVEGSVDQWDGRRWHVVRVPAAPGLTFLQSVSCPTSQACIVVGTNAPSGFIYGANEMVAYEWAHNAWSELRIASQPSWYPLYGGFLSIDCSSARRCVAVGSADVMGRAWALVERWDGHAWTATLG